MKAWGRLLRLSLAPSAAADIAAGIVVGARGWPGGSGPWRLMLASLCVYHGGMALNDWADREQDRRLRPTRPLPSGAIDARSALALALCLLVGGPLLACSVGARPALLLGGAALAAALYDLAGRGRWRGPLLLASCRALNLATGIAYASSVATRADVPLAPWAIAIAATPLAYASYVFFVSCLGRLEDSEEPLALAEAPSVFALCAACALLLAPWSVILGEAAVGAPGFTSLASPWRAAAIVLVAVAASGLVREVWLRAPWSNARVMQTMGLALRRLLCFTAAAAMATDTHAGAVVGLAILCGYPLSYWLRGIFPPS